MRGPGSLGHLRFGAIVLLVLLTIPLVSGFLTSPSSVAATIFSPDGDSTVVTIDALGASQILAYGPNGSLLYRNDSY